jgi:hypothetical protein
MHSPVFVSRGVDMTPRLQAAINRERVECEKHIKANPDARFYYCHWHNKEITPVTLSELPMKRVECICTHKPKNQRVLRLRNFRPVLGELPFLIEAGAAWQKAAVAAWREAAACAVAAWQRADAAWQAICSDHAAEIHEQHNREWPDNTWNGKSIFEE